MELDKNQIKSQFYNQPALPDDPRKEIRLFTIFGQFLVPFYWDIGE